MKTDTFMNISRSFHKVGLQLKKYSPSILMGVGIASGIATTLLACNATVKAVKVVEKSKKDIDEMKTYLEEQSLCVEDPAELNETKKELVMTYAKTGVELVKLYAPAAICGILSVSSVLASQGIVNKRNAALSAAYFAADQGFKDYRKRVTERFGESVDKELRFNVKEKEVPVLDENGKDTGKVEKVKEAHLKAENLGDYIRVFNCCSVYHTKDSDYNLAFLKAQERFANDKLRAEGFVFLNDVLVSIGLPRTRIGNEVGWVYDEKNPVGDNYISFGVFEHRSINGGLKNADAINGLEYDIYLDFNCDGYILDLIP